MLIITSSKKPFVLMGACLASLILMSCEGNGNEAASIANAESTDEPASTDTLENTANTDVAGSGIIDLDNLYEYANQAIPTYISDDNNGTNSITNAGATLGRVLFYDTKLSSNDSVSCSSCHQQSVGFSDPRVVSEGVNGVTGRHSMRLVNARFANEARFFWDERANSLEEQVTQPIRDHAEMGFSGSDGAPSFDELLTKMSNTSYYPELFTEVFGNSVITEERMQSALAQFIRSIQSFDSRYDMGRSSANNENSDFQNFTAEENAGKRLFMTRGNFDAVTGQRLAGGGLGCNQCHRAPEFDIDDNSRNNGVITVAGNISATDISNTRSPTLRDVFSRDGTTNGPFMHDGSLSTFDAVLDHYNDITVDRRENPNLDPRLNGADRNGNNANAPGQKLVLTDVERNAVTAFMRTLSGQNLYTDPKWSNPFLADGSLLLNP